MREEKFHQFKSKNEVGAFEAKTHFSEFLVKVASGEEFTITRHGQKIAMLVPFCDKETYSSTKEAIRTIKKLRSGTTLGQNLNIKEMRSMGRK